MRILVTGACGFIGGHFIEEALFDSSVEIVALCGLTYASDPDPILFDDRVKPVFHDLRQPLPDKLKESIGSVDCIVNFAADSHVDRSIGDPVPFIRNNVDCALHMLEYAREVKPKIFLQISTDEIYGPAPIGYSHREWDPAIPSNPYSASKASQEAIAMAYWRTYGVPVIITNTMNNFGDRQHPEKFIPMAVRACLAGAPITIHAKPLPAGGWLPGSRVWIHAADHADGLKWILANIRPEKFGDIDRPMRFNVCGSEEIDNLEVVLRIGKILDIEPVIKMVDFHSSRPGHDLRYSLDGRALAEAGWQPQRSLDKALEDTVRKIM